MESQYHTAVNRESSVNLRDVFWVIVRNWKKLLLGALIGALLLGCYGGIKMLQKRKAVITPDKPTEAPASRSEGSPAILSQPTDLRVEVGTTAAFSVATSGEVTSYKWQFSKDGSSWSNVNSTTYPSALKATLNFQTKTDQNGYLYRCVVTFEEQQMILTSDSAKLTVLASSAVQKITIKNVLVSAFKKALIGFLLGLAVTAFLEMILFIINGYFVNPAALEERYGVRGFGVYPSRKNEGLTRKILDKMTYRPNVTQQESAKLVAANMNLALPAGGTVYLTGTIDDKRLESICKVLRPYVEADLKPLSCVNISADSVNALRANVPVVCVERILASKRTYVDFQMNTIARSGAECAGFVLIE
ncbi:MAG: hypothetical protein J5493_03330 [Lachnospiraceae bacterium]|nr:hypothetical protein [Lachnospiraceae bacterium]